METGPNLGSNTMNPTPPVNILKARYFIGFKYYSDVCGRFMQILLGRGSNIHHAGCSTSCLTFPVIDGSLGTYGGGFRIK